MAETVNGSYKAELIRRQRPWRGMENVELATLTWGDWFSRRRLHQSLDYVSPAEYEAACRNAQQATDSTVNPENLRGLTVPPTARCPNIEVPVLEGVGLTRNALR